MARKALVEKSQREPKYSTRKNNRCKLCGRSRGYMRKFRICRICFRKLASEGKIPGVTKASW
ncbi:MAG: type Z 30S ribosomal protein S14 [Candidatus Brocadiia bacterium]|jgi:small subunit ribosomal protein S14